MASVSDAIRRHWASGSGDMETEAMPRRFTIRVRGTIRRTITVRQIRRQHIFLEPTRQAMLPANPEAEHCPVHHQPATIRTDDAGQRHVEACCEDFKAHIERRLDSAA